jgi:CelD/BcsL family acetyltransferase involved in cellulose biosynthesis
MRLECRRASALEHEDWDRWQTIVDGTPALASPFFAAAFCRTVARHSPDLEVAVIRAGGAVTGYFPFHRGRLGGSRPLAKQLSDYHGLICAGGAVAAIDARALLRACRLSAFEFDHMLAVQRAFAPFGLWADTSPVMDLAGGFDAYAARVAPASDVLARAAAGRRRLERDFGPVSVAVQSNDEADLALLFRLKSEQYRRTGRRDVIADPWARAVLTDIFRARASAFAGVLSVLRAGTRVLALHLGMRSAKVLHYWFPAYDREYARYSPGVILLAELACAAPGLGIETIDLGKGDADYKRRFSTGAVPLLAGRIERPSLLAAWRMGRRMLTRVRALSQARSRYARS